MRRLWALTGTRQYQLVWIEKELFPWLPGWGERLLAATGVPYVLDYDDAVFHYYDRHRNPMVRAVLGRKIEKILPAAALCIAGNHYLAEFAEKWGARRVEIIPTVVDLERYSVPGPGRGDIFSIGWIGTPRTSKYLALIKPALREVCARGEAKLVLIGAGPVQLEGIPVEIRDWSETSEVSDIQSIDVGIMPLADDCFERGKCGYKLIQYMACGKPVVASPVGVNRSIFQHGKNGFLAQSHNDWLHYLNTLKLDREKGSQMGMLARQEVEAKYCVQVTAPKLLKLLRGVVENPNN